MQKRHRRQAILCIRATSFFNLQCQNSTWQQIRLVKTSHLLLDCCDYCSCLLGDITTGVLVSTTVNLTTVKMAGSISVIHCNRYTACNKGFAQQSKLLVIDRFQYNWLARLDFMATVLYTHILGSTQYLHLHFVK